MATATDELFRRGMAAINAGRPTDAETLARATLAREWRNAGAAHLLGLALLAQGRAGEAIAPLELAVRNNPNPTIETQLGVALRQSGKPAEALTWLQHATTRQPAFPPAFYELCMLLAAERRMQEAEAVLKAGVAAAPNVPELWLLLGGIHLDRAERAPAKLAFERALTLAPGHPGALYSHGVALMDDGEFAPAAERFRQVLARDARNAQARVSLGTCLLELGRIEEAVATLRAAADVAPELYGKALSALVNSSRGRFWLRPSAAAAFLKSERKR
jgi:tetratricopeptide (TPR) repeat protein